MELFSIQYVMLIEGIEGVTLPEEKLEEVGTVTNLLSPPGEINPSGIRSSPASSPSLSAFRTGSDISSSPSRAPFRPANTRQSLLTSSSSPRIQRPGANVTGPDAPPRYHSLQHISTVRSSSPSATNSPESEIDKDLPSFEKVLTQYFTLNLEIIIGVLHNSTLD